MFKGKENSLQSEVEYLRGLVKQLTDQLLALSGEAHARYHAEKRTEEAMKAPTAEEVMLGKIDSIKAMNDDERRQKQDAMEFAQSIIGGGSHG